MAQDNPVKPIKACLFGKFDIELLLDQNTNDQTWTGPSLIPRISTLR